MEGEREKEKERERGVVKVNRGERDAEDQEARAGLTH